MKMYATYHEPMTLKETITEIIGGICFCIFFLFIMFMIGISDEIDQSITQARQASSTTLK